jgi:hypothetical protein
MFVRRLSTTVSITNAMRFAARVHLGVPNLILMSGFRRSAQWPQISSPAIRGKKVE